jgi:2,5-diketo-D-gluconate reductase B
MQLPPVGLGTMGIGDPDVIETALDVGYRHLDTAKVYGNEDVVGEGVRGSDVPREDVTVATKLWIDDLAPEAVRAGTETALEKLGLDRVDLLYVHRPRGDYDPRLTPPALDDLRSEGLTGEVGLSNFEPAQLEVARDSLDAPIAAHQVEFHPHHWSEALLADAQEHDYPLVAYSPLIGGAAFDDPVLQDVAEAHDATPAAVSIAWVLAHDNVVTIPKASSRAHLVANWEARHLELTDDEVSRIDAIETENELYPE